MPERERGEEGKVAGEDTELAVHARSLDLVDVRAEGDAGPGDDLEVDDGRRGVGHFSPPPSASRPFL